jgi:peptide/nickel transport system permease protein
VIPRTESISTTTRRVRDAKRSRRPGILRSVARKPLGVTAAVILMLIIAAAVFAEQLAPFDPLQQDLFNVKQLPDSTYLLGTDSLGRDVLSRLLFGARDSLSGVLLAVVVALAISIPVGVTAGYVGGWFDRFVMRMIDINMAIPNLIVTLAVLAIFNNNVTAAMITVGILSAARIIRVIRSTVLGVREELYIRSAEVIGLSAPQILLRHVLPRTRGVIIVQASMDAAIALGIQTGLAFLGFGPPPPNPTWGGMVSEASTLLASHVWLLVPTGGIIAITTLAFGLLGDAVRDANAERYQATASRAAKQRRRASVPATLETTPADAGALLSVRDLQIAFGEGEHEIVVVDGADFDIRPGETVGLVGESGSGKTVTALAILGLLTAGGRIPRGSITFDGREITGLSHTDYRMLRGKEIAMISQEPMVALDPVFRIGSQLMEAVRTHDGCGRSAARKRAIELLREVRLPNPEAVLRMYPHQVSGGMAQRVVIALALAGRPRLLIADEPTTALDVTVQAEILDLLRTLQRETGMAILLVTHDWAVVADICSRAVVMYAGQVVEKAGIREMFSEPRHPYTRGLLESSPHLARKGEPLPAIGGMVPPPGSWPSGCHFAPRCPLAVEACRGEPIPEFQLEGDRSSRCIRIDELVEVQG